MDREKQVEEMAKTLCIYDDGNSYCFRRKCDKKCRYGKFAKALYEAGYTKQPTADVQEVRHAKFELIDNGKGVCSNCHRLDSIDNLAKYCRYCGAKIDKEAEAKWNKRIYEVENETRYNV